MFVDDDISNYIKVFQAFEDGGAFIRYASIVFICVGAFVLIVGFLGCCGAIKESRCMLGMVCLPLQYLSQKFETKLSPLCNFLSKKRFFFKSGPNEIFFW